MNEDTKTINETHRTQKKKERKQIVTSNNQKKTLFQTKKTERGNT